jgi:hypothetical protein
MGAELWHNFAPYQPDPQKALDALRQQVFRAGEFYRSELGPRTIDDAIRNGDSVATRSVLDIDRISPTREILAISPVSPERLEQLFHTERPTRRMIEEALVSMEAFHVFLETYDRLGGFYITVCDGERPSAYFFAGWSAD